MAQFVAWKLPADPRSSGRLSCERVAIPLRINLNSLIVGILSVRVKWSSAFAMQFGNVKSALLPAKVQSVPARPIAPSAFRQNAANAFRLREPLSLKSVLLRNTRNSEKPQKSAIC